MYLMNVIQIKNICNKILVGADQLFNFLRVKKPLKQLLM